MSKITNEPSLDEIDDYRGTESKEKRDTIRYIILGLLVLGGIYTYFKNTYSKPNGYIGVAQDRPINTAKN